MKQRQTKEGIQTTLVLKFSDHELAQSSEFGLIFSEKYSLNYSKKLLCTWHAAEINRMISDHLSSL